MSNTIVRTNVPALNSHRNLGKVGNQQSKASARLSSGYRINSAADDAAGLGISEKMRSQIRGLDQASANAQDGISMIQTAEGAMSSINEMVIRIRELVVKAANDTNAHDDANMDQSDRQRIQDEIDQLMNEIDATRDRTEFNTRKLIDGTLGGTITGREVLASDITFEMLPSILVNKYMADNKISGVLTQAQKDAMVKELGASLAAAINKIRDLDFNSGSLRAEDLQALRDMAWNQGITKSNFTSDVFLALYEAFGVDTTGGGVSGSAAGGVAWNSTSVRAAIAWFNSFRSDFQRITQGGAQGVWFQVGANASQGVKLHIKDVGTNALNRISEATSKEAVQKEIESNATLSAWMSANGVTSSSFTFENLRGSNRGILHESGEAINLFLHAIDSALAYVTAERSNLGAMQNRLEYTIENLDVASENLTASESRIRDADMAKEMMALTQANVLQQAATSMLAQANQAPQNVLQLLG